MSSSKNKKVLIIDDEPMIREIFSILLSYEGFDVETADNGKMGLNKVLETDYDIILSDIRMPGGDGLQFLEMLPPNLKSKLKIFVCTGYHDLNAQEAIKLGALKVFAKPFEFSEISKEIKLHIA